MGIAAYNRGTKVIARQLDPPLDWRYRNAIEILERLNGIPKAANAARLFAPVIIRSSNPGWWLMTSHDQADGWGAYGYFYKSINRLMADNAVELTGCGQDGCSFFYKATPMKK